MDTTPTTPAARDAVSALTITNVLLGILIVGIAAGAVYGRFFYEPEVDGSAAAAYAAEAKERLAANAEEIQNEVAELAAATIPPITRAVYEQASEDFGLYVRTLENEGDEYLARVEQIFLAKVKDQYGDFVRQHKQVLKEEFPDHASDENVEQVLTEFERTINKLVERYYLDEFRKQSERTAAVWQEFEPVEVPGPNEPSLSEQLADYTADWAVLSASQQAEQKLTSGTAAIAASTTPTVREGASHAAGE